MGKRKTYSDKFKAGAIVMLQSEGYPDKPYALEMVAQRVGVPGRTLRRWFNGEHGQPPVDVVTESKKQLTDLFEDEIRAIMDSLPGVRDEASYKDRVTGAAILVDKIQLLTGGATTRQELTGKNGGAIDITMSWRDVVEAAKRDAGESDDNR